MRGRKPKPTALKRRDGNPGRRPLNPHEPQPEASLPTCPEHLSPVARSEWERLAAALNQVGLLTRADRAALAAYCQCYGRWVEAEERLTDTPAILKTPAGYVQQSPWLSIANKQLELMGRYMTELGLTPAARSRIAVLPDPATAPVVSTTPLTEAEWEASHGTTPCAEDAQKLEDWLARIHKMQKAEQSQ